MVWQNGSIMWVYEIKEKSVIATDLHSLRELKMIEEDADWLWIDCIEPSSEEFEIVSELFCNEPKILDSIREGRVFSRYKKHNDCTLLSVSAATLQNEVKIYPLYMAVKEKMLLTLRSKGSSKPVEYAIQTLQDCVSEAKETSPSFVVGEVLRETTNDNLEVVMALREMIEKVEEEAIAKPSSKAISKKVFALKRQMAQLYRLLWSEEQIMSSLKDGLIPNIELCRETILGLEDSMSNVERELEFLNSYDNALDGVLRLQDLGMIHIVERTLIYLTIIILVMNVFLIVLEVGILDLLLGR